MWQQNAHTDKHPSFLFPRAAAVCQPVNGRFHRKATVQATVTERREFSDDTNLLFQAVLQGVAFVGVASLKVEKAHFLGRTPLQKIVGDFCCIKFGGFCRGFTWRIFLALFPTKMRRTNPATKSATNPAAQK